MYLDKERIDKLENMRDKDIICYNYTYNLMYKLHLIIMII